MDVNQVLLKPVITEKATIISEQNKYVFKVATKANKDQIKQAIKTIYKVEPTKVNIVIVRGKERRLRLGTGFSNTWKKAIVTLKDGDKIDLFETK